MLNKLLRAIVRRLQRRLWRIDSHDALRRRRLANGVR